MIVVHSASSIPSEKLVQISSFDYRERPPFFAVLNREKEPVAGDEPQKG